MTFTAVVPTSWQTDRSDLNAALGAILDAFMAAVPNIIRVHWSEVPASLSGEGPFVYLGDITEAIGHDAQTRQTTFTGWIGYVDVYADPQETNNRVNVFADYMRDLFTANARIIPPGILQQTGFTEGERQQGPMPFTDARVTFTYRILEGRTL